MPFIIHQRIELRSANAPLIYQQEMELGDRYAHQWRVTLQDKGQQVDLDAAAAAVSAFFRRADGSMLSVSGTIDEGDAVVLLPAGAYGVEGFADGVMRVSMAGGLMALAQLRYRVARHSSDTVVDPDHVIPDISELLAQIEAMKQGTAAANTAAGVANDAANEAYDAATAANTSAQAADTAAASAGAAADRAGTAAQQVTDALVPSFSIGTVTTLPAGSKASATITGDLPKNPVLNLALPKGRDGDAGEGVFGSTIAMSEEDPTKVADAIAAAGKVETVAGVVVEAGTKNVPLKGSDLPMSASDPTRVADAIAAAGKVETVAGVAVEAGTKNVPLKGSDLPMSASDSTKVADRIGSGTLETDAQNLTGAVNELVGNLDTLDGSQIPVSASDSTSVAAKIGSGALETDAQDLTGAVNELAGRIPGQVVDIDHGGTGATTAEKALENLGAQQTLKLFMARNPNAATVPSGGTLDVPLNWSSTGHNWMFNGMSYAGNTGLLIVNTWFNNSVLTATVRNVTSNPITIEAKGIYLRVIYTD